MPSPPDAQAVRSTAVTFFNSIYRLSAHSIGYQHYFPMRARRYAPPPTFQLHTWTPRNLASIPRIFSNV
jgi:cytolysin (calcineurin-like family phosphatase)